ncbi:hypothetical protein [Pseudomonas arsenicoxydans]|uniref:Uncharacterized protein n=1 Tax=Pseudomonas arsenicoxydans TaxID=702115 RepID=A0A4P6G6J2_9PSED|nr:hypothetical protein [Pseudomonas arsenicoxydans]QAY87203.1 hypothetical protein CUN61_26100 [Pseudomonas arsenicoxydans]
MKIILSPQRRDDTLEVIKSGRVLIVNGEDFDFTQISEGSTLPQSAISSIWFAGDVSMQDGELTLTLLLPFPWNFSPEQAFPADLMNVPDGPILFPQPLPVPEVKALTEDDR